MKNYYLAHKMHDSMNNYEIDTIVNSGNSLVESKRKIDQILRGGSEKPKVSK